MLWICIVFVIRNNVKKYGYFRNLMFYLQRVTGIISLIFIAWHVWQTRLQVAIAGAEVNYQMMEQILTQPFYFWFYIVSILAVVFHLSNGLWSFCVTWVTAQSPLSQQIVTYATSIFFFVVS